MVDLRDLIGKQMKCYDLCREVYQRLGKHLPEVDLLFPEKYQELIEMHRSLFKKLDTPEPFCLVLFKTDPPHLGIWLPGDRVMHSTSNGVVVSRTHLKLVEGFYALRSTD